MNKYTHTATGDTVHRENSVYIKKLTSCGNPDVLLKNPSDLSRFGLTLVPEPAVVEPTLEEKKISNISMIDQALRNHFNAGPHGLLGGRIEAKASANKPIAKKVSEWMDICLQQLEDNTDLINSGAEFTEYMTDYPPCPHTMREIRGEL